MNPWPLIIAEIRHYRAGFMIAALLIGLSLAMGIALTAQERAVRSGSARAADRFDLLIGAPASTTQLVLTSVYLQPSALNLLPASLLDDIRKDKGVRYAAPLAFGDYVSANGLPPAALVGTTAEFASDGGKVPPTAGRLFNAINEAMIGSEVALPLGATFTATHGTPEQNVIESHPHLGLQFHVVGTLPPTGTPWDRAILVPIEALWKLHEHEPDESASAAQTAAQHTVDEAVRGIPVIAVRPRSVSDAYRLRRQYRSHTSTAVFPAEVLTSLYQTLGDIRTTMSILLLVAQGLVFIAVMLAVLAVLSARRKTFAVLRAMGAPPAFLFITVWGQVALMVCAGILFGLGSGWLGAQILAHLISDRTGVTLSVSLGHDELGYAAAWAAASLLLATLPALLFYRIEVARALRDE